MIKYNDNTINDWNFGDDNIIKVYKHGAVVFYKFDSKQGGYKVCYAVVDDITQYSETEFEDVYDKATEKWYKLNNLNQYEEYGIYGEGRNITYYEGKLTVDDGYEYEWNGSSWANLGEISGDTHDYSQDYLTLQALESGTIGFSAGTVNYSTDSGSTWNTLTQGNTISVNQGDEVLFKMSGATPNSNTGIGTFTSSGRFNVYGNIMSMQESDNFATATTIANYKFYFKRLFAESKAVSAENMVLPATTLRNFCYNELFKGSTYLTTPPKIFPATALTQDCYSNSFRECPSLTKSPILPALTSARASYGWMFQDCTSLSEITCLATNTSAQYATYDWVKNVASSGTFYKNPNASWSRGTSAIPSNWNVEDYVEPTPHVYPKYYDEKSEPLDNLTFNTMAEAQTYAEANCVYVGLKATINGDKYVFSGNSTSGYEWVYYSSRLPVGYTEVEYIQNTGTSYINTSLQLCSAITNTFQVEAKLIANRIGTQSYQNIFSCMSEAGEPYQGFTYRFYNSTIQSQFIPSNDGSFTQVSNSDGTTSVTASSVNGLTYSHTYPLTICCGLNSSRNPFRYTNTSIYTFKVTLNNGIAADYVPTKRNSDSVYGLYDLISDSFLTSPNGNNFAGGNPV